MIWTRAVADIRWTMHETNNNTAQQGKNTKGDTTNVGDIAQFDGTVYDDAHQVEDLFQEDDDYEEHACNTSEKAMNSAYDWFVDDMYGGCVPHLGLQHYLLKRETTKHKVEQQYEIEVDFNPYPLSDSE
eukprot:GEMP01004800.1.p2 GENE.GEMP01004800.1~~GEMP01004800.1.p2  ORF type:complete len:129 (+),score=32.94 GEMP01004800.1:95-481(+)